MKIIKKLTAVLLSAMLVCSAMPMTAVTTYAAEIGTGSVSETNGDYNYYVYNNEVTITSYWGSDVNLVIPSEIDGYKVTTIGDDFLSLRYSYRDTIESITIPNTVRWIGSSAFSQCTKITNITIPDSVTVIDNWAFSGCTSLKSITIPSSVNIIFMDPFSGCTSLKDITVDSGNQKYCSDNGVLFNKDKTELVRYPVGKTASTYTIPDSVTKISSDAFDNVESLTSIIIPDSVTSISSSVFSECINLKNVKLGNGVTEIGDYAFSHCESLSDIKLPDSLLTIGKDAFSSCYGLTSVTIPKNVQMISGNVFSWCSSLTEINVVKENEYFISIDGVLLDWDKSTIYSYPNGRTDYEYAVPDGVTSIGKEAFVNSELTKINFPYGLNEIGKEAFAYSSNLIILNFPDSVTRIDDEAFYSCDSLRAAVIPYDLVWISSDAFGEDYWKCEYLTIYGNDGSAADVFAQQNEFNFALLEEFDERSVYLELTYDYTILDDSTIEITDFNKDYFNLGNTDIVVPDKIKGIPVTSIGSRAFAGAEVTSVVIPEGVKTIENSAFYQCTSVKNITIPDSIEIIEDWAFFDCENLEKINLGNNVKSIGQAAFCHCYKLTNINIPQNVSYIGNGAFSDCTSLIDISVSQNNPYYTSEDGVLFNKDKTTLMQYPSGNTKTEYNIPDGVSVLDSYAFQSAGNLINIAIPDSVAEIGYDTFEYCESLKSIVIPENVKTIHIRTFSGCTNLENVVIPNSVSSIEEYAFAYCTSLKSITLQPGVTNILEGAFYGCWNLSKIYGYRGSFAETYANNKGYDFVDLDNPVIRGEINSDGIVDVSDVTSLQMHLANYDIAVNESALDVNNDGISDVTDVTTLQMLLAGYDI